MVLSIFTSFIFVVIWVVSEVDHVVRESFRATVFSVEGSHSVDIVDSSEVDLPPCWSVFFVLGVGARFVFILSTGVSIDSSSGCASPAS